MEDTNLSDEPSRLRRIGDGAASLAGKTVYGVGYCAGRAAPTVRQIKSALLDLKTIQFVLEHYKQGLASGEAAAYEASARRQARKWMAQGERLKGDAGAVMKQAAEDLLTWLAKLRGSPEAAKG